MRFRFMQPVMTAMSIAAGAGILAGGIAMRPAFAVGGAAQVGPFAVVHCTSNSPCQTYSNQGQSDGVEGINTNKNPYGIGVFGNATGGGTGVEGSGTTNNGVSGFSTSNAGINGGTSTGWSVYGYTFNGIGVYGQSVNNNGGVFESNGTTALVGAGYGGIAIEGIAETNSAAIDAIGLGDAIDATTSGSGYTIVAQNQAYQTGNGIQSYGYYIGQDTDSNTYPWVARDGSGNDEDYTTSTGEVFSHGGYTTFSKTRNGDYSVAYAPKSTTPTVEDDGTAHLVNGTATVRLDGAFADSIDMSRAYHVMLTPDGDTKGLYVASKSPNEFVVREVQGGRGTLDFDYHIYASQAGRAGVRMAEMTPQQMLSVEPHAPAMAKLSAKRPKIHTKAGMVQL